MTRGAVAGVNITNLDRLFIGDSQRADDRLSVSDAFLRNANHMEIFEPPPGTVNPNLNRRALILSNGAVCTIEAGARLVLTRAAVAEVGSTPRIVNHGTIEAKRDQTHSAPAITEIQARLQMRGGELKVHDEAQLNITRPMTVEQDSRMTRAGSSGSVVTNFFGDVDIQAGATLTNETTFVMASSMLDMTGGGTFSNSGTAILRGLLGAGSVTNAGYTELLDGVLLATNMTSAGEVVSEDLSLGANARITNTNMWQLRGGIGAAPNARFTNSGTVTSIEGGGAADNYVQVLFDNQDKVQVLQGDLRLKNVVQIENGMLSGGTWLVPPGTRLIFDEAFDTIKAGTTITFGGDPSLPGVRGVANVEGELQANGDTTFEGPVVNVVRGGKLVAFGLPADGSECERGPERHHLAEEERGSDPPGHRRQHSVRRHASAWGSRCRWSVQRRRRSRAHGQVGVRG